MEEINHFFHEKHPLKLIDSETIIGGGVIECDVCEEPLSIGDSAYACTECRFSLHKPCSQLPRIINFPSLYHCPLRMNVIKSKASSFYVCNICCQKINKGFAYLSINIDDKNGFNCCSNCFLVEFACKAEDESIQKEASNKLQHKGHPNHTLSLQLKPASFRCDACNSVENDLFYLCDSCNFWIHKTCASLLSTIELPHHHPKHPLVLVYSLPEKFYRYSYYCKFCNKYIRRKEWLYHCGNCRFFAHIKCAINAQQQPYIPRYDPSTSAASNDVHSLLHFPMAEAFVDPLKLLHPKILAHDDMERTKISHWSHPAHPLTINVEDPHGNNKMPDINSGDRIKVCYACVRPLSFPYYSCKEDGCSVMNALHKYCAHLPRTLKHQLHRHHTLDLVDTTRGDGKFYKCNGCFSWGNTFAYKCETKCNFYLCVNCAFLPITIKHQSHNHPLTQLINPKVICQACNKWSRFISYSCKDCDFQLDLYCAMRSPISLSHRYCKGHEIPLTYPPVDDHPEDFYCDICEEEMNPNFPLYHCQNCKYRNSFHLGCISRIDYYTNIWRAGTITPSYHKHPLTYARRKKTPKYVCSVCNQDINGFLVLECRAKTCNFNICYACHLKKIRYR